MTTQTLNPSREDEEFLVDRAYEAIRGAIVRMELGPGSSVSEGSLSQQMGISRTPIREALKRLEDEGLVRIVPRRGAYVTDITAEDIVQIYQLREALECFAIGFVPRNSDPTELKEMVAGLEHTAEWIRDGEIARVDDLDTHLHRFIARAPRNDRLIRLVDQLLNQVIRLRRMTPAVPGRLERQMAEHRRIILALDAGDVEEAREALRSHLRSVMDNAVQIRLRIYHGR
jgi:GntR family transcriptional regulator, rspAB operon transcriptional repressor